MGLFDIIGKAAELPFRVAQVPTKIVRVVDEATIDSGAGKILDEVNEETVGEAGRSVRKAFEELE